jgi:hypothetical protein
MGLAITIKPTSIAAFKEETAMKKAIAIVDSAQGNFALEGQATTEEVKRRVVRRLKQKLMAGSKLRLWS